MNLEVVNYTKDANVGLHVQSHELQSMSLAYIFMNVHPNICILSQNCKEEGHFIELTCCATQELTKDLMELEAQRKDKEQEEEVTEEPEIWDTGSGEGILFL